MFRPVPRWFVSLLSLLLFAGCRTSGPSPSARTSAAPVVAIVGARVYPAPGEPSIRDATVLTVDGTITSVGARRDVALPAGATVIDGAGTTVVAGFWNCHVHFTESKWSGAAERPAEQLSADLRAMLTRWGVVHAVDTGSLPADTIALRRRIESGEVAGPQIFTAGVGFAPAGGSPFYIRPAALPELTSPAVATATVDRYLATTEVDLVKLFTGSFASPESIVVMPVDVVRAATDASHRHGKIVVAHPSNSAGANAALLGGVDVLAHTFPSGREWDRSLPERLRAAGMAMIPTLKLWSWELPRHGVPAAAVAAVQDNAAQQVRMFARAGGQLLFGTDVGYMTDYDPAAEYALLSSAGLSFSEMLAALTTAPAARFAGDGRRGTVSAGAPADLVVLDGDPTADARAWTRIRYTLRAGRVIYEAVR